jgi:DNA polymerase III subunit delta'
VTSIVGHAAAQAAFLDALRGGHLHHAWLLAGPQGVGKGSFARAAALRILAEAQRPDALPPGLDVPAGHPAAALVAAGSHPDLRVLARLPRDTDKPEAGLARSIKVDQVRALQPFLSMATSLGPRRVIIIDAIDDLEREGANALLKSLEEPPAGTVFLLVSHMPGRLLPTIRSRCRMLRFASLSDEEVAAVLRRAAPELPDPEIAALLRAGEGSPGRALGFAGLEIGKLDAAIEAIAADGDPDNARRAALGRTLAPKAAQPRYEAFLERAPAFIAGLAKRTAGPSLPAVLATQAKARDLAGAALGLSLDPQATVWEMSGLLAGLAPGVTARARL